MKRKSWFYGRMFLRGFAGKPGDLSRLNPRLLWRGTRFYTVNKLN